MPKKSKTQPPPAGPPTEATAAPESGPKCDKSEAVRWGETMTNASMVWKVYRSVWPVVSADAEFRAVRWAACEAAWRCQEAAIDIGANVDAAVATAAALVREAMR